MTTYDLFHGSLSNLLRTRGRSILTMTGIVIGIMSVILMLSIGEAAQGFILDQVSAFGTDVVMISNGSEAHQYMPDLFLKESITMKDVEKLQQTPWVTSVVGRQYQDDKLTANGLDANIQLVGTMPDEIELGTMKVEQGFFLTQEDVDSHSRVAVLGNDIAKDAFGQEDPIGKRIKISKVSFRVIGVLERTGSRGVQNLDEQVLVPITSVLDLYNKKYVMFITAKTSLDQREAKQRLQILMREQHDIDNPEGDLEKDDFAINTQEDIARITGEITQILQIMLISVAAISLLVGGIGIMNIMYVSVTERIKEIGLRKSLGAQKKDILRQFLAEAVMQTLLGGIIGIVFGIGLTWIAIKIINYFQSGWTFSPSINGMALGLLVSASIGIIFGYFPARRAAGLKPIEALRHD